MKNKILGITLALFLVSVTINSCETDSKGIDKSPCEENNLGDWSFTNKSADIATVFIGHNTSSSRYIVLNPNQTGTFFNLKGDSLSWLAGNNLVTDKVHGVIAVRHCQNDTTEFTW